MPGLYIITGANGSGKSSLGFFYLPPYIQDNYTVFDGDKLFIQKRKELYPSQTRSVKEAGRIANEWLTDHFIKSAQTALDNKDHFVYEGHFVQEETWSIPEKFKRAGYKISVLFFGLKDVKLSALRVFERAKNGGHNVPPYEIEANYYGNLNMLNRYYDSIDDLKIIDTSEAEHITLAVFKNGKPVSSLSLNELPEWFTNGLPALNKALFEKEKI